MTRDRKPNPPPQAKKSFWNRLGPGLITGAADDDPSGIGTYSVAGAQFGYSILWLTPLCIPLMIAVQEMCGRVGAVTGKGLVASLRSYYPRSVLWGAVGLLFLANIINIWADLNVMAASAEMLVGMPFAVWLTLITLFTLVLIVFVPYRVYVRFLKWLTFSLAAYVFTALLPSVHNDWGQIARRLVLPTWERDSAFALTVVGYLGTTISPYLFFWQTSETVEEEIEAGIEDSPGHRKTPVSDEEIRAIRFDTVSGMVVSQLVTFFIIICTAATLHSKGITQIETAQDAAKALLPLGRFAYVLFTMGIVGVGLLAVPTLAASAAYALGDILRWRCGLYCCFGEAQKFYYTIAAVIVAGFLLNFVKSFSPVKGLLYAAVLNGIAAPPLIILLLLICNNRRVMKENRNGLLSNVVGGVAALLMTAAVIVMFLGLRQQQ